MVVLAGSRFKILDFVHHTAPEKHGADPAHHASGSAMEDFQKADQSKAKTQKSTQWGAGAFTAVSC